MFDHEFYHSLTGKYTHMAQPLPVIPHPIIALPGNLFWCLSTSAAADGTRAEDWYALSFAGVYPRCNCKAWRRETGCKHVALCEAQMPALIADIDAQLAADRAARRAARLAREEGRAAA